jgi:hypothetical protein
MRSSRNAGRRARRLVVFGASVAGGALALPASSCLVFDGKVATDATDATDAGGDAGARTDADANAADAPGSDAPGSPDAPSDAHFCARQHPYLFCADFDETDSAAAIFSDVETNNGGSLAVDPNVKPAPPSLPNALDIHLPRSGGAAAATGTWKSVLGFVPSGLHCTFDILFDAVPPSGDILELTLNASNYEPQNLFIRLQIGGLLVTGFLKDGGNAGYENGTYPFVWTTGAWHSVALVVDYATSTASASFDGDAVSGTSVVAGSVFGQVFGGNITVGSGGMNAADHFHLDNVLCRSLGGP